VYAFLLVYIALVALIILGPLSLILHAIGPVGLPIMRMLEDENTVATILMAGIAAYMYAGFRRAYDANRTRAAINAVMLSGAVALLVMLYHNVLFYTTFWTT